jgi:hypothetical protein
MDGFIFEEQIRNRGNNVEAQKILVQSSVAGKFKNIWEKVKNKIAPSNDVKIQRIDQKIAESQNAIAGAKNFIEKNANYVSSDLTDTEQKDIAIEESKLEALRSKRFKLEKKSLSKEAKTDIMMVKKGFEMNDKQLLKAIFKKVPTNWIIDLLGKDDAEREMKDAGISEEDLMNLGKPSAEQQNVISKMTPAPEKPAAPIMPEIAADHELTKSLKDQVVKYGDPIDPVTDTNSEFNRSTARIGSEEDFTNHMNAQLKDLASQIEAQPKNEPVTASQPAIATNDFEAGFEKMKAAFEMAAKAETLQQANLELTEQNAKKDEIIIAKDEAIKNVTTRATIAEDKYAKAALDLDLAQKSNEGYVKTVAGNAKEIQGLRDELEKVKDQNNGLSEKFKNNTNEINNMRSEYEKLQQKFAENEKLIAQARQILEFASKMGFAPSTNINEANKQR